MRIPVVLLLCLLSLTAAHAADIAGQYADKGTMIPTGDGGQPQEMSLHAILQLDFDYERVRERYAATDHVEFRQGRHTLEARMSTADDTLRYHGAWSTGEGYTNAEDQVVLRLRGAKHGGDTFVCVMSLVEGGELLQVEVSRLVTTSVGPTAQPVGTYLFPRLE